MISHLHSFLRRLGVQGQVRKVAVDPTADTTAADATAAEQAVLLTTLRTLRPAVAREKKGRREKKLYFFPNFTPCRRVSEAIEKRKRKGASSGPF